MTSLSNKIRFNYQAILEIRQRFSSSSLSEKIVSLIVHGSSLYREVPNNGFTDIDLELILTEQQDDDYQTIKKILSQIKTKTEIQLRYRIEVEEKDNLIRRLGYKLFTFYAYANGICLIGDNIYQQLIITLDPKRVKRGILISVQLAYKDYRKTYLNKHNCAYMVNKNIMVFLLDLLMYEGILDYRRLGTEEYFNRSRDVFVLFIKHFGGHFDNEDVAVLGKFVQFYNEGKIYEPVFPVIDKIALWFSKRVRL